MAPCRQCDIDCLVRTLCESTPTSTEETLWQVLQWAEEVGRRQSRTGDATPSLEEEPAPEGDQAEASSEDLPLYCVTHGPAAKLAPPPGLELGKRMDTWDQLWEQLEFTQISGQVFLYGNGFHVKRVACLEEVRAFWAAEARSSIPAEHRLGAAPLASGSGDRDSEEFMKAVRSLL